MHVIVNGGEPIAWADFIAANQFSAEDAAFIRQRLDDEGFYERPASAEAEFTVEVAPKPAPFWTVAIYLVDRAYGGAEEGGWWYDTGVRIDEPVDGINPNDLLTVFKGEDGGQKEALAFCEVLNNQLDATVNKGRRPISSVLSTGRYRAFACGGHPEHHWPTVRPHYE